MDLQNIFKNLPLENLMIETDSPFLAPDPMRGKKMNLVTLFIPLIN